MGTQKNRLNETVLLSTQNRCYILLVRKYLQFYAEIFCYRLYIFTFHFSGVCLEAIGEAKVEWMTSSDIQASDEEVFNYTTVLPIKGIYHMMLHIRKAILISMTDIILAIIDKNGRQEYG